MKRRAAMKMKVGKHRFQIENPPKLDIISDLVLMPLLEMKQRFMKLIKFYFKMKASRVITFRESTRTSSNHDMGWDVRTTNEIKYPRVLSTLKGTLYKIRFPSLLCYYTVVILNEKMK